MTHVNRWKALFAGSLLLCAPAAFAAETEKPPYPPGSHKANEPRTLEDEDGREPGGKELKYRQRVEGQISTIDPDVGIIVLDTIYGSLRMLFPPDEIRNYKKGDSFVAQLELWPGEPGFSRAGDAPGTGLSGDDYTLPGEVYSMDKESGRIEVATTKGIVQLRVPPEAIQPLKQKDRVTVKMIPEQPGADTKSKMD